MKDMEKLWQEQKFLWGVFMGHLSFCASKIPDSLFFYVIHQLNLWLLNWKSFSRCCAPVLSNVKTRYGSAEVPICRREGPKTEHISDLLMGLVTRSNCLESKKLSLFTKYISLKQLRRPSEATRLPKWVIVKVWQELQIHNKCFLHNRQTCSQV